MLNMRTDKYLCPVAGYERYLTLNLHKDKTPEEYTHSAVGSEEEIKQKPPI